MPKTCNYCKSPIDNNFKVFITDDLLPWCGSSSCDFQLDTDVSNLKHENEHLWGLFIIEANKSRDKSKLKLTPESAITAIEDILRKSAPKHKFEPPTKPMDFSIRFNSALRHLIKWRIGENIDHDDKLPHLDKGITQLVLLFELTQSCPEHDDRHKNETFFQYLRDNIPKLFSEEKTK